MQRQQGTWKETKRQSSWWKLVPRRLRENGDWAEAWSLRRGGGLAERAGCKAQAEGHFVCTWQRFHCVTRKCSLLSQKWWQEHFSELSNGMIFFLNVKPQSFFKNKTYTELTEVTYLYSDILLYSKIKLSWKNENMNQQRGSFFSSAAGQTGAWSDTWTAFLPPSTTCDGFFQDTKVNGHAHHRPEVYNVTKRHLCVLKISPRNRTFQAMVSTVRMVPSDSEDQWGNHFAKARICTCNTWLTQPVIKFTWPPRNVARCSKGTRKAGYSPRPLDRPLASAKRPLCTIKQSIPSALSGMQTKSNESPEDNDAMTMKFFPFTRHNVSISLSLVRESFSYWSTDWISTREIQIWHSWWNLSHFYCPTKNCY